MQAGPVYEVRQKVYGLLNGTFHAAIVLEVGRDASTGEFLYYVRYVEQDSRMDRWLSANQLRERHQGRLQQQQQLSTVKGVTTRRQSMAAAAAAAAASSPTVGDRSNNNNNNNNSFVTGNSPTSSPLSIASASMTSSTMGVLSSSVALGNTGSSGLTSAALMGGVTGGISGSGGGGVMAAKGSASQHTVKVSTVRARKDSSFFSRTKNIHSICIGPYEVETWYFSPYHLARPTVHQRLQAAAQYVAGSTELTVQTTAETAETASTATATTTTTAGNSTHASDRTAARTDWPVVTKSFTLHICPFCLRPLLDHAGVIRHLQHDCLRHPPGDEIYRDPVRQISVLELDGKLQPVFCEHLALLSKLFLEHKALDHDMTPFLFYVLCGLTPHGLEVLGYFSKEKQSPERYNLSCVLVLPQFQSRGIGRFLIELSYELSRREGRAGTPEKPLSDLGEKMYVSYWSDTVLTGLGRALEEGHCVTVDYLVQATSMMPADVTRTLQYLNLLNGDQLCVSEESLQRCFNKQLQRARQVRNYTFYSHLLSWAPGMYEECRYELPPPIYVPWHDGTADHADDNNNKNKKEEET